MTQVFCHTIILLLTSCIFVCCLFVSSIYLSGAFAQSHWFINEDLLLEEMDAVKGVDEQIGDEGGEHGGDAGSAGGLQGVPAGSCEGGGSGAQAGGPQEVSAGRADGGGSGAQVGGPQEVDGGGVTRGEAIEYHDIATAISLSLEAPSDPIQHDQVKEDGRQLAQSLLGLQLKAPLEDVKGDGECLSTSCALSFSSEDYESEGSRLRADTALKLQVLVENGAIDDKVLADQGFPSLLSLAKNLAVPRTWSFSGYDLLLYLHPLVHGTSILLLELGSGMYHTFFPDSLFYGHLYPFIPSFDPNKTAVIVRNNEHFEALSTTAEVGQVLSDLRVNMLWDRP